MAKTCSTGDGNPVWSKGLCLTHWRQEYGKPLPRATTPIARSKQPIKQVSERMAVARKQYNTVRKLWMVGRTKCQAQLPVCTVIASQVHHMEGRDTIERLLDTNKWMAVCPPCHRWITDHSKEAIAMGLSMRRNGHLPPVEKSG